MKGIIKSLVILLVLFLINTTNVNALSYGDYEYYVYDDTVRITKYNGSSEVVNVPSTIDNMSVTSISSNTFKNNENIKELTIPGSVMVLQTYFVYNCPNLSKVTLNEGIEMFQEGAFYGTNIEILNIPASVNKIMGKPVIGNDTTGYNNNTYRLSSENNNFKVVDDVLFTSDLKTLIAYPEAKSGITYEIPSSVEVIAKRAFSGVRNITNITIPNTVKNISEEAFMHMPLLEKITLDGTGSTIYNTTIGYCDNLKEIIVNSNVRNIKSNAFRNLAKLERIFLPNSVLSIEKSWVFQNNENAIYVIPDTLTKLENGSYAKLYDITMINGMFKYDEAKEVFDIVNNERVANKKETLKYDRDLTEAAMKRARELVLNFSHTRANGTDCFTIIKTANGENILEGVINSEDAMNSWMNSSVHKSNILNSSFKSMGVGVYKHGNLYYWVQLFSTSDSNNSVTKTGDVEDKNPKEVIASEFIKEIQIIYDSNYMTSFDFIKMGINETITPLRTQSVNTSYTYYVYLLTPNSFKYESLNSDIFEVDQNGKITALSPGLGTMRVTLGDTVKEYQVEVLSDIPITVLSIGDNIKLNIGESKEIPVYYYPTNSTNKEYIWSSSNTNVVTVDKNGKVTAVGVGAARITATTSSGVSAYINVTVSPPVIPITGIKLNQTKININKNGTYKLNAIINPTNTTNSKVITWKSSNPKVAIVDKNGKVSAVGVGTARITATTSNGISTYAIVTVPNLSISSIKLNKKEIFLKKNGTYKLNAIINPTNTTDSKVITWISSNKSIAIVDKNGVVKGIKNGSATITAKASNGKIAKVRVVVGKVAAKNVKVSSIKDQVYTGKNIKPKLTIKWGNTNLVNGKDYTLTYKNNKKIGTASIIIKFKGNYSGSKTVKFKIIPKKVSIKNPTTTKKSITVKYNKVPSVKNYQIAYRIKGTNKWKTISTSSNNKKISKLTSNKNYEVRVRGYIKISGKTYYGNWSNIKTIKVK